MAYVKYVLKAYIRFVLYTNQLQACSLRGVIVAWEIWRSPTVVLFRCAPFLLLLLLTEPEFITVNWQMGEIIIITEKKTCLDDHKQKKLLNMLYFCSSIDTFEVWEVIKFVGFLGQLQELFQVSIHFLSFHFLRIIHRFLLLVAQWGVEGASLLVHDKFLFEIPAGALLCGFSPVFQLPTEIPKLLESPEFLVCYFRGHRSGFKIVR